MLFVTNWGFSVGLAGGGVHNGVKDAGVLGYFNIEKNASFDLVNSAVNWGITIGRGIGSVAVALLLVKFAHKNTTIIALALTLLGIPAQFMPANAYGYVLFLILRTLMAIGGTMLIILTQPIAANFFTKKEKSIASQFGIWFYPLGTILSIVPFVFVGNVESVRANWQIIFTVLAVLNVIPLLIMVFFGSKFDVKTKEEKQQNKGPSGWSILRSYLKKKSTWAWVLLYGGWLCAVVFPTIYSVPFFADIAEIGRDVYQKQIRIWSLLFLAAVFVGPISIGLWSRFNLKRKWYIATVISLGIFFYILSMVTFITGVAKGSVVALVFFYIFGFLTGMSLWGIQGVMLNTPHEYKDNDPKKIGWMFSLIWGLGYLFFTLVTIIISLISLVGKAGGVGTHHTYAAIGFSLIVIFSALALVGVLMLKEPSADAKTFPKWMSKLFKSKK
ncbi:hexose phosphate transporter [Mycoplasma simbae]|uniref:hexose phosphate transporter n=1 Tax=Mycoplasma simbae TaxID=36744 RepID=UPI003CCC063D